MMDFIDWFKDKNFVSVHSFTLYVTLWMTFEAYKWAGLFALGTDKQGAEVALIIGAVTAPITYLQKSVFDIYSTSRKES